MPRINIEDSIFKDARFIELCIKTGSVNTALGELVFVWMTAQKYFLSHGEIPNDVWVKQKLSKNVLEVNLAERSLTGVRVCGQNDQFSWIQQASNAGKKSAEKRSKTKRNRQPKRPTGVDFLPNARSTGVQGPCTSSSFSSSFSTSTSGSKGYGEGVNPVTVTQKEAPTNVVWNSYSNAYFSRYGTEPVRNGVVNSQLTNFLKRVGQSEAPDIASFYLTHNANFYVQKMHPVGLLLMDAEKLRTEWATGTQVTSHGAKALDRTQANKNVFQELSDEYERKKT